MKAIPAPPAHPDHPERPGAHQKGRDTNREYWCWTCLDFTYLPEIGPCPDCQPDAYTEHIATWLDHHGTEAA